MNPPGQKVSNMLLEKSRETAPKRMKGLGQSRNDTQLWMYLVEKVKSCKEQYCIGTWNIRSMNQGKLEVVKQEEPIHYKRPWKLGKIESRRRRGQLREWDGWMASPTHSMDMSLRKLWEMVKDREAWCTAVPGITNGQKWLSDWKTTISQMMKI